VHALPSPVQRKIIFVEHSTSRYPVFWTVRPLRRVRISNSPTGGTTLAFLVSAGSFGGTDFPSQPELRGRDERRNLDKNGKNFEIFRNGQMFSNGEF